MFDRFSIKKHKAVYQKVYQLKKDNPHLNKMEFRDLVHNECGAMTSSKILDTIITVVAGLFAVAYVLPSGMSALGGANTTGWPSGTENFIVPIGIFVMIGLLVLFARSGGSK